ncbi:hypothetical protein G6M50_05955 [Agrobacterium rhizogenes]|nr:hypothetical protein [Rhizobium rhizogenes]NTJ77346.1 hypothetical protein [Rhizobium rhizogenes]
MNIQLIASLLTMLLSVIPQMTNSKTINSVVIWLEQLIPTLVQEYTNLLPIVKNIIGLLKQNSAVTPDQLSQLQAQEAVIDKAFEDALSAYLANHPEPAPAASAS